MPQQSPTSFYLSCSYIRERLAGFHFKQVHPASTESARLFLFTIKFFTHIKLVHGDFGPPMKQTFQRIDRSLETRIDDLHFVLVDRFQHIIGGVLTRRRTADADFESHKLRGPKGFNDGLDAVVASMPSSLLDAKAARFQIQIVVDKNQIVGGEL